MVTLPEQYIVEKFCQYTGYPKYNKRSKTWTGGCPVCREGNSWGKKRRLYYKIEKHYMFCFNCGWKGSAIEYIKHVTGMSFAEIMNESKCDVQTTVNIEPEVVEEQKPVSSLPDDSINIYDLHQTQWWLRKGNKVVRDAINFVKRRRLDTAINKPNTIWLSLTDYIHKNRIILPFYSKDNKIIFYQTRSIYTNDKLPKYLSKSGGGKSIFNINQIDSRLDHVFLFEGPIDSCFVKNGLAVAGITTNGTDLNHIQQQQLQDLQLYKKVWVLDSQWLDRTSYEKSKQLIEQGETVFIWPENIGKRYKDLNEMCCDINKPGIGYKFIIKNSFTGLKGKLLLSRVKLIV